MLLCFVIVVVMCYCCPVGFHVGGPFGIGLRFDFLGVGGLRMCCCSWCFPGGNWEGFHWVWWPFGGGLF